MDYSWKIVKRKRAPNRLDKNKIPEPYEIIINTTEIEEIEKCLSEKKIKIEKIFPRNAYSYVTLPTFEDLELALRTRLENYKIKMNKYWIKQEEKEKEIYRHQKRIIDFNLKFLFDE